MIYPPNYLYSFKHQPQKKSFSLVWLASLILLIVSPFMSWPFGITVYALLFLSSGIIVATLGTQNFLLVLFAMVMLFSIMLAFISIASWRGYAEKLKKTIWHG